MSGFEEDGGPPRKDGRFAKGRSGNPGGRPKKARGTSAVWEAFNTQVPMTSAGRRKNVSLIAAHILKLGADAMAGDKVSKREFGRLAIAFGVVDPTERPRTSEPRQVIIVPVRNIPTSEDQEDGSGFEADRRQPRDRL